MAKLSKYIKNNITTTEPGFMLDARVGELIGQGGNIPTITANSLAFFDNFPNSGFYQNIGALGGTYSAMFSAPFLKQRVDTIDKVYTRSIDVSIGPGAIIPEFRLYGTSQLSIPVPEAEEIKLILGHQTYTVNVSTAENFKISADVTGCSVVFPSLGSVSRSITFIIPTISLPITFNGVLIPAGNTVFAIYTLGVWAIDSTVVNIPVIPNYSDISVQHKVNEDITLIEFSGGKLLTTSPTILGFLKDDKVLLSKQNNLNEIGVYQITIKTISYALLQPISLGINLNIIRVMGFGSYQNQFDGFDTSTISFLRLVDKADYSGQNVYENVGGVESTTKADVELSKRAGYSSYAGYSNSAGADEDGNNIPATYATKEALDSSIRPDTMLVYEKATFISNDFGDMPKSTFELSKLPISIAGIIGLYTYQRMQWDYASPQLLNGKVLTINNDSMRDGATNDLYVKYFTQIPNLALSAKENIGVAAGLISELKDGVGTTGDTLQKLYNLILGATEQQVVPNIAARDAFNIPRLPYSLFVADDGDGKWAVYQAITTGMAASFVKISDPDLLNAVMSSAQIKLAYESNPDTNALTNALLTKLNSLTALTSDQLKILNTIPLVCSDETTDITASTTVRKNRYVFQTAQSFTNIIGELIVPAVGGTFTVIVKKNGVSIFSTNLTFNGGANTTRTATTPAVLTSNPISFAIGDNVEVFVTGIGSITAGQGLTIYLM